MGWAGIQGLTLLGLAFLGMVSGCISPPKGPRYDPATQKPAAVDTGKHFWWGIGTSSFQNEDRAVEPGSPEYFQTDWDVFAKKGRVPGKGNGTYSWSDFDKDVSAMKQIGVTHARISIEWARLEPKPGQWNDASLAHYVGMVRKLKAAGIEPVVTLWHFTMPDWLVNNFRRDATRWLHPDFESNWEAYVERVTKALAPYVSIYVPQNEPNGDLNLGWVAGQWPPGYWLDLGNYRKATEASVVAFRKAADIVHRNVPHAKVMVVESLNYFEQFFPYDPTTAFFQATQRSNFDHLDGVADKCDLIGLNYYYTEVASPVTALALGQRSGPGITMLGWKIKPSGLRAQINVVWKRYRKPIVITENGIATTHDIKRIKFIMDHLIEVDRAKELDGCDIRGYFVWTLADNYEWQFGYKAPFGLSKLSANHRQYILRPSAMFYRGIIQAQEYSEKLKKEDVMPDNVSHSKEVW